MSDWRTSRRPRGSGSRRPPQNALYSRTRRERFTKEDIDHVMDVMLKVGEMEGRKRGYREAQQEMAELLRQADLIGSGEIVDPDDLSTAEVIDDELVRDVERFLQDQGDDQ